MASATNSGASWFLRRFPKASIRQLALLAGGVLLVSMVLLVSCHLAYRRWRDRVWSDFEAVRISVDSGRLEPLSFLERPTRLGLHQSGAISLYFEPPWYALETKLDEDLQAYETLEIKLEPPTSERGWLVRFPGSTD